MLVELKGLFSEWIAAVNRAVETVVARFRPQRRIALIEGEDNVLTARAAPVKAADAMQEISFRLLNCEPSHALPAYWDVLLRGSRIEILLNPDRVMFRSLEFPKQAVDFLDGMIRTQIDRLTPWTANDALFGWSPPIEAANQRIQLMLAATSKELVQPLLRFAGERGAASVAAFAEPAGGEGGRFKILETSLQGSVGHKVNVPRVLRFALSGAAIAAAAALLLGGYLGSMLDAEQLQLQRRIAERRASLRLNQMAAGGSAQSLLAKRKQTTPSGVMVLEAISRVLPDSTYVTELTIEGEKVQIVGISQDAPSLIRLMEQSPQFSRATFFAPTTRSQGDSGERFHIEVHAKPYFGSGS